jgi:hypothetical protein
LLLKIKSYNNTRAVASTEGAMNLELPTDWGAMKRISAVPPLSKNSHQDDGGGTLTVILNHTLG